MKLVNTNNYQEIQIYGKGRDVLASYKVPEQISGFEYEVLSCKKAIEEGKIECPEMQHAEILRVMKLMDDIRNTWGMKLPGDEE